MAGIQSESGSDLDAATAGVSASDQGSSDDEGMSEGERKVLRALRNTNNKLRGKSKLVQSANCS